MYNIKVIEYPTGVQVRVYEKAIREERWNCDEWGVIPEPKERERKDETEIDRDRSLRVSADRSLNKVYEYARANLWEWFLTLTFNPDKVDSFNYEEVTEKLSKWLNNLRRTCPNMKYLVVPEQHKSGRWHFHGLFSNIDELRMVDSGHKDVGGKTIYNVGNYSLGFSTATKVEDTARASSYLSKYITKDLTESTFGKKRYWASRNLDLPYETIAEIPHKDTRQLKRELLAECTWHKAVEGQMQSVDYFEFTEIPYCLR